MSTDNLQAVINVAQQATQPHALELGKFHIVSTPAGVHQVDLTGDQHRAAPSRKVGTYTLRDVSSFLGYHGKHADADSEIYADVERLTITSVLDAHTATGARWAKHRAVLALRSTTTWTEWVTASGRLMDQETFANFLEDHLAELLDPDAATMLEVAQSIQATTKADFTSSTRLTSGQRQLSFVETVNAKAGAKGTLEIPETFVIGLRPFEGADGYKLTARFRYRISGNVLQLGFKLERPDEVRALAFADVLAAVTAGVQNPVMNGTPAGS